MRALDMQQWWDLDLPEPIRRKIETPPYSVGPAGVATEAFTGECARPDLPISPRFRPW